MSSEDAVTEARVERALDVSGVDSGYGEAQVLHDLNLHLNREEIVCLIGPNGAGKSTVLKTIFGLLKPWTGTVRLDGEDITGTEPEDLVRMGVGYVPQVDNVFGSLTIDENLRMGGVARSGGVEEVIGRLYDRFPILDDKREAKARTLSGGQRQVLAFARALVMEPDVLLIDEPSAGLAPSIVADVFEDVQTVNELGTAILMVEQNAREGLSISDRGYVLDQGTVAYEDEADGLLDNPEVSQLYLGGADYE
ncbi:amino acid/amide ABC transporter ATP-binding protein 2, HAAT family [Halogeometricum rufum]|uniref:Amino acid/amide ABC transporter ATP-binding protein 2, HAAT family n=1 Tax=Halogeometricum rufum TaxID=553469 RepID=A0A1I6GS02_9EURY|nr:ABC transporter ATP-binding protein [Halogeometricum rufum]MUV59093.1 ATP-binding cassette domain-containing protein [Halogeometricum sp. CBA1124]SFR44837.1 amino acid/amide ABC transporter ATP-binding protein 2, HAAT family [Halogeometricum rufum]